MTRLTLIIVVLLAPLNTFSQESDTILVRLRSNIEIAKTNLEKIESRITLGDYQTEKEIIKSRTAFSRCFRNYRKNYNRRF